MVKKLVAVEIDRNLAGRLEEEFGSCSNCRIVQSDFLKYNFADFDEKQIRVIGNIPYNITSPIFFKIIENRNIVKDLTMLIQKEVAQRIVSRPNTKDYGILAVFSQVFAQVKILMHVPRTVFSPKPKVESSLVQWVFTEQRAKDILDMELFKKIVKQAFGKRRKTLKNALLGSDLGFNEGQILVALERADIDPRRRAETISVEGFVALAKALNK